MKRSTWYVGLMLAAAVLLSACATSEIVESHPLFVNPEEAYAQVIFFRPMPQRTRGVADNDVIVELNKQKMMDLSAGEYAVFRIKPSDATVTLKNLTYITYKVMPEEVSRSRRFSFEPNKTYYIQTLLKVEEYRGLYFVPKEVEEGEALKALSNLKPVNQPLS